MQRTPLRLRSWGCEPAFVGWKNLGMTVSSHKEGVTAHG